MKHIPWRAALAAMAIAGSTACAEGAAESAATAERGIPVRTVAAESESLSPPIHATGTLGAKEEVVLSFLAGGVIERIEVGVGAVVRAGQRLASLELSEAEAAVAQARSAASKAERDLERARRLYADSVIPLAQLEDAATAAEITAAQLERARFGRRFAEIVAPADGVILRRAAEPGERVGPGAAVLVLASRDRGTVLRVGLSDRDVVRVRRGDPAVVRFDAHPGVEYAGRVSEIAAAPRSGTGTFVVEVTLPVVSGLISGLVGNVVITPRERRSATVVPVAALLEIESGEGTLFVVGEGGRAQRRRVGLGVLAGERVEIATGVTAGERVVTAGAAFLSDGAAVDLVP
jgi:RND family efflux transporter MFP subunit